MEVERNMFDLMNIDMAEKLVEQLNPVDIIEVATISPQWRNAVNAYRIGIKEIYIDCSGMYRTDQMKFGCAQTVIGFKPLKKSFVHFFLYEKTQRELNELLKEPGFVEKEFNDETLVCQIDQTNIKVYSVYPMQSYHAILTHMLYLLSGEVQLVNIAYNEPLADEMLFWLLDQEKVKECKNLKLPVSYKMSGALLNRCLDLPNLDSLSIHSRVPKGFLRRRTVKVQHLDLDWSGWITRRFLFGLNCETIYLGETQLNVKDINAFIKFWLEGDNKTLKCLQFGFCLRVDWRKRGIKHLMDEIEYVQRDPAVKLKKSKRYFKKTKNCTIDMAEGMDITRKDGTIATINYSQHTFNFVVWGIP